MPSDWKVDPVPSAWRADLHALGLVEVASTCKGSVFTEEFPESVNYAYMYGQ